MSFFAVEDKAFLQHAIIQTLKIGLTSAALFLIEQCVTYYCNASREKDY